MNYAYHLDAGLYARFLRRFSEGFGVTRIEGRIGQVETDAESGFLTALTLQDGTRWKATCSWIAPAWPAC